MDKWIDGSMDTRCWILDAGFCFETTKSQSNKEKRDRHATCVIDHPMQQHLETKTQT
jgi:hypothetical protein